MASILRPIISLGKGAAGLFKTPLALLSWPRSLLMGISRRLGGFRSNKVKGAILICAILVSAFLAYLFWLGPKMQAWSEPGKEFCEFLARPAAELYIDGQLASKEVPPIYSTQLGVGEHDVRFVSPDNKEHSTTINVEKGRRVQWFMNFVEGQIYQMPTSGEN